MLSQVVQAKQNLNTLGYKYLELEQNLNNLIFQREQLLQDYLKYCNVEFPQECPKSSNFGAFLQETSSKKFEIFSFSDLYCVEYFFIYFYIVIFLSYHILYYLLRVKDWSLVKTYFFVLSF